MPAAQAGLEPSPGRPEIPPVLVSIVIDNYNYERFLRRCIDGALAQTYPRVEVVVVDDGSTDDSVETIKSYGDRVFFVGKPNEGQASAVNAGFAACRGDLIIVLDSDDEIYPHAVSRIVAEMTPEAVKIHWRLDVIDAEGHSLGFTEPLAEVALAQGDVLPELLRRGRYAVPVMSGNAYPRWVLNRILPVPVAQYYTSADQYLVGLSALLGPVAQIDEVLGAYRIHGSNASKPTSLSVRRLARNVEVDRFRNASIARAAIAMGHLPASRDASLPDFALNDQFGLRSRIISLRLDPDRHPVQGDRLIRLAWFGVRDALWRAPLDPRRRLLFALWFLVMAFGPYPMAHRAAEWLHVAGRRPSWTRALSSRRTERV